MGALDVFLTRQGEVVEQMAKAAEQIPQTQMMWKPCGKSLPWIYLLHHTCVHRRFFLKSIKGQPYDFPGDYGAPANQPHSPAEAASQIRQSWQELKNYLSAMGDPILKTTLKPYWGGEELTVEQILWELYAENVHHRGQAWLYARMNGITPPVIWGTEQA
ncbi:MAG: DinB family protein [Nitrospinae bacterium]|nr:DinB family protein [Nitrospinota bacterium]